jgi:uncharacterized protein YecE (DUF72 family)
MQMFSRYEFPCTLIFALDERIAYTHDAEVTLLQFLSALRARMLYMEFNHWSWNKRGITEPLWAKLSDYSVFPVGWDGPRLPGIVQRKIVASRHGAHVRMLGRNAADWFDIGGKYAYRYSREEIGDVVQSLTPERPLYITFANDPPLRALHNAIDLAEILSVSLK